jgi:hypothetical protein
VTTWLNESSAAGMGGADASADRLALPAMNGVRRSCQLIWLPPARGLPVVAAEGREGVR